MRRLLCFLVALGVFLVGIQAEVAATETDSNARELGQYGIVYYLDSLNNHYKRNNVIEDDGGRDFRKLPDNGLLIIRLLPKSMLEGTVLEPIDVEDDAPENRSKRSPGRGGGCSACGGGGSPGGGYGGGSGGHGGGGSPGGGYGGGNGGEGGGGKAGAWSSSSSGAYGKGYGR